VIKNQDQINQTNLEKMKMLHKQINTLFVVAALFVGVGHASAAERLKPFELASTDANGDMAQITRSEEHTSELQSHLNLVCRLLL